MLTTLLLSVLLVQAPAAALVSSTLIDGHGGVPIRNSVIGIRGERIEAVGQPGTLVINQGVRYA